MNETHRSNNLMEAEEIKEPSEILPPTDVGVRAWLQVIGGFMLMLNTWGIAVSYGTFQTYYTNGGIKDASTPSSIAWIGSVQAFLLMFGPAVSGKFFDAGHFRPMVWIGSFLVVFGTMMVSLSSKYYHFMLAQGTCMGSGMGLLLVPSVGLPGTWFNKRRGLALGIVTTGSSVGGIIFPVLLHELIPRIGFAWAVRVMGFISLVTLLIAALVLRQRLPPRQRGSFIEYRALKEPQFALYVSAMFITFLGFFMFYTFVQAWAISERIDLHGLSVFYVLPIVNAASAFGRLFPSFISDYVGPLNVQAPAIAVSGILVLSWLAVHNLWSLLLVSVLYGFFSGALIALPPTSTASLTPDLTTFGGRLGIVFLAMGCSSLIGNPVTGIIVQGENGKYDHARVWSGIVMIVGSSVMMLARLIKTNWRIFEKS